MSIFLPNPHPCRLTAGMTNTNLFVSLFYLKYFEVFFISSWDNVWTSLHGLQGSTSSGFRAFSSLPNSHAHLETNNASTLNAFQYLETTMLTLSLFLSPLEILIVISVNVLLCLLFCMTNSGFMWNLSQKTFPDNPNLDLIPLSQALTASNKLITIALTILYFK